MKFRTLDDAKHFLLSEGHLDLLAEGTFKDVSVIPDDVIELFLQKRTRLVKKTKDQKKALKTKAQWRKSRYNMLSGIRSYHKSTRGKRHHRELGRFLATREGFNGALFPYQKASVVKALSSAETHAYIELDYYYPSLVEEVDYWLFLETVIPIVSEAKIALLEDHLLSGDQIDLLVRLTDKKELVKALSEEFRRSVNEVERAWKEALAAHKEARNEDYYYHDVLGLVKEKL